MMTVFTKENSLRLSLSIVAFTLLSPMILLGIILFLLFDGIVFGWKVAEDFTDRMIDKL